MGLNPTSGPLLTGHANTWYLDALAFVIETGEKVTARGRSTFEILNAMTVLPDPRRRVLTIPFRRANPFFQAVEPVWILAGRSDAAWIMKYNSQLGKFLDGSRPTGSHSGVEFHGAYGERLRHPGRNRSLGYYGDGSRDQLKDILAQLRQDPGSRRAVATIHNPEFDNPDVGTLDRPCQVALSYQLRNGRLHATTFNRSNDLNLGLAYTNIVQFTVIQEFLAVGLGLEGGQGRYTHLSSSLHVYDDDPIVDRLIKLRGVGRGMSSTKRLMAEDPVELAKVYQTLDGRSSFDVYQYADPVSMGPWDSPDSGFEMVEKLAATDGSWVPACAYWGSVAHMMRAWNRLRNEEAKERDRLVGVLGTLTSVQAIDWQIACLEYLHRWACRRRLREDFLKVFPEIFWQMDQDGPVASFITHDTLEGEVGP